jgi:hypothetical protein
MVRKITGYGDVALVDDLATCRLQAHDEFGVAIGLRVIFVARIKRAAAERNAEHAVGSLRSAGAYDTAKEMSSTRKGETQWRSGRSF